MTQEDIIKRVVQKYGTNQANGVLTQMSKDKLVLHALSSELGQELFRDLMALAQGALDKFMGALSKENPATQEGFVELQKLSVSYKCYTDLIRKFAERTARYNKYMEEITGNEK